VVAATQATALTNLTQRREVADVRISVAYEHLGNHVVAPID
jgi:hypothetical protein